MAQGCSLVALDTRCYQGPFHGSGRGGGFFKFVEEASSSFSAYKLSSHSTAYHSRTIGGYFYDGGTSDFEYGVVDGGAGYIISVAVVPCAFRRALSQSGT